MSRHPAMRAGDKIVMRLRAVHGDLAKVQIAASDLKITANCHHEDTQNMSSSSVARFLVKACCVSCVALVGKCSLAGLTPYGIGTGVLSESGSFAPI